MGSIKIRVKITRGVKTPYIKELDIEEYLYGVVSSEMSDTWPIEALKVQAICARTYAYRIYKSNPTKAFHVDDTTSYQAYKIRDYAKIPNTVKAVKATAGMILTYKNAPISAVYSASNGGMQKSAKEQWGYEYAYLPKQPDQWTKNSLYPKYGHGVGMSQRGAQWAANHGIPYDDILEFYYPHTLLVLDYGRGTTPLPKPKPQPIRPTLKYGSTGEHVEDLQELLVKKGFKLKVDGIFGNETRKQVMAFQAKVKIAKDGIVGPQTWAKLLQ